MTPQIKFTLVNIIFFGVVGSLIAGVIPTIFLSHLMFDAEMLRTDKLFVMYVSESLILGFIPAAVSGFIYSRMYKNAFFKTGAVDFWKELKLGALSSFLVLSTICFIIMLTVIAFSYLDKMPSTSAQIWNFLRDGFFISLFLIFSGVIGGLLCANLICCWNRKLISDI